MIELLSGMGQVNLFKFNAGKQIEGGYFVGIMYHDPGTYEQPYALIVSAQEYTFLGKYDECIQYANDLQISFYDDWEMPTYEELVFQYRKLKPTNETSSGSTSSWGSISSTIPQYEGFGTPYFDQPSQTTVSEFIEYNKQSFLLDDKGESGTRVQYWIFDPNVSSSGTDLIYFRNGNNTSNTSKQNNDNYIRPIRRVDIKLR